MMALSIALSILGLGTLFVLLHQFTVYALPAFVGLSVGFWAIDAGAGAVGGIVAGLTGGVSVLVVGQLVLVSSLSPLARHLVALTFAAPAGYAAYRATLQVSQLAVASGPWELAFSSVAALVIGWTAVSRLTTLPSK